MAEAGRLVIVCGLPGAGKTTASVAIARETGGMRFSPDDWITALGLDLYDEKRRAAIEALQWGQAKALLALGGTAIIEWGTWGRSERDRLRDEARALAARVELVLLDPPLDELFARISRRGAEDPPITRAMLEAWSAALARPDAEELALYDPPVSAHG